MPEPTAEEVAAQAAADKAAADAKAKADAEAGDKKFSQADLDRIAGDTRKSAKATAEAELLASLGVTDLAAAQAALTAAKEAEDAKLTETERLTKELAEARAENERTLATATALHAASKLEGALRDAGVTPERIPAAMKLADHSALVVNGTDVTGIPEVIEGVKALSPEWFGAQKPAGAVDASKGGTAGTADLRSASRDDLAKEALKYGVKL